MEANPCSSQQAFAAAHPSLHRLEKTPVPVIVLSAQEPCFYSTSAIAFKFVDPAPFMPRGCHCLMVGQRKPTTRVVLGGRRRHNGEVAIATIEPMPNVQVSFPSIRELLDDFLRNHRQVGFRSIQPCPYGQVYVRFNFIHDRHFLISGSPHEYDQYRISFVEHNKGWNNKTTTMNCEAWIVLLGYNIDFWTQSNIEKTVAEFGKLLVWEEDPSNLARIVVKVRVVDLSKIPWFMLTLRGTHGLLNARFFSTECWEEVQVMRTHL